MSIFLLAIDKEDVSLCEEALTAAETCAVVCCVGEQVQSLKVENSFWALAFHKRMCNVFLFFLFVGSVPLSLPWVFIVSCFINPKINFDINQIYSYDRWFFPASLKPWCCSEKKNTFPKTLLFIDCKVCYKTWLRIWLFIALKKMVFISGFNIRWKVFLMMILDAVSYIIIMCHWFNCFTRFVCQLWTT